MNRTNSKSICPKSGYFYGRKDETRILNCKNKNGNNAAKANKINRANNEKFRSF